MSRPERQETTVINIYRCSLNKERQVLSHSLPPHHRMKSLFLCLLALGFVNLTSCSSVKNKVAKLKNLQFKRQSSNTPPVVQVRREDLRKTKSSKEKILAWNRTQKSRRTSSVDHPSDFDLSSLPGSSTTLGPGILPPLKTGSKKSPTPINPGPELILPDEEATE